MTTIIEMPNHPAPFPDVAVNMARKHLEGYTWVLDPFAGVGGVHRLGYPWVTVGVEIEPLWAFAHAMTQVGDATKLMFPDRIFEAVFTSPCYGNRMADHHNAQDGSRRVSYKHNLGQDLQPNNAGAMQWGDEYRALHKAAWEETSRVCERRSRFLLVIKNHIRKGEEQPVKEWHQAELQYLGYSLTSEETLPTQGMRYGANRQRCPEYLMVFDR